MAQNNIEAYQGLILDSQQANNVLRLNINDLKYHNDIILHQLDSVRSELSIKAKQVQVAATQTQTINVIESKGVGGDIITILKDSVYQDSIRFNDQTSVSYTIGKDTVSIGLDIENEQYLYVFDTKKYKNKKSFIMRLLTFDFKKVHETQYKIQNSNNLIKVTDVRVVETTTK